MTCRGKTRSLHSVAEVSILRLCLSRGLDARGCRLLRRRGVMPWWRRGSYATNRSPREPASTHSGCRTPAPAQVPSMLCPSLECNCARRACTHLPVLAAQTLVPNWCLRDHAACAYCTHARCPPVLVTIMPAHPHTFAHVSLVPTTHPQGNTRTCLVICNTNTHITVFSNTNRHSRAESPHCHY